MRELRHGFFLLLAAFGLSACEGSETEPEPQDETPWVTFQVDASSQTDWVFFDLDAQAEVEEDGGWDLAFRRQVIASNGPEGVAVAIVKDRFEDAHHAPEAGYHVDPALSDEIEEADLAFHQDGGWYDYDMTSHTLSPKGDRYFVVLSTEGKAYAIKMMDYYATVDGQKVAGHPSFAVRSIEAPTNPEIPEPKEPEEPEEPQRPEIPEDAIVIDATGESWVYFELASRELTDGGSYWDLGFNGFTIATNGPAGVKVAVVDGVDLAEVTEAPADGYHVDPAIPDAGEFDRAELAFHGDSPWYEYDPTTHVMTARERVYVIVTAEERVFAVQLLTFYDEEMNPGFPTFVMKELTSEASVQPIRQQIDAQDPDTVVYFDLDSGELTDADGDWDLAFKTYWIATNGAKGVKVATLDETTLADPIEIPVDEEAYHVDELDIADEDVTLDDVKRELAFHQGDGWYEYVMPGHIVRPREKVYVVISTAGTTFAVQMVDYYDGEGNPHFPTFEYIELD